MTEREKLRLAQEQSQSQWKKETEAKAKADKDQKSAQVAARLDQVISSPSVKKAVDTKSAQVASRLDTGTYAVNTGTQKRLVEQEKNRKSTQAIERLNQQVAPDTRGTGFRSGGGFGSQQSIRRPLGSTILDVANYGAGQFVVPVATAIDVGANMIVDPLMDVIGFVRQKNPENTLLGKGLTGITDATADFLDWTKRETLGSQARAYADAGDSKAGRTLVDLGAGVVSALPNAALAMMSGGASVGGQLAVQPVGISGTVANAASKMLKNPLAKVSFIRNFGSGFEEAKASGASDAEALTAAGLSGLMNSMVEVSGGIEALPGKAGAGFRAWLGSALQEGLEEPVQGVVSNAVSKGIYDPARPVVSLTDPYAVINPYRMGQEFALGTAYDGDANVYRWNYFYSPVQIGDETVGVRVAVRDMATPLESQIYNWGIKQDATLGGGGRGQNRIPNDASSVASENSISGFLPTVNGVNLADQYAWQMPVWPVGNMGVPIQTQAEILRQMEAVQAQHRKELEEAELERAFLRGFILGSELADCELEVYINLNM